MAFWPTRLSTWFFGSTSGGSLSIPVRKMASASAGRLVLPMTRSDRLDPDKYADERISLTGLGVGVSVGKTLEAVQLPNRRSPPSLAGSTSGTPGGGTRVLVNADVPDPVPASYFDGPCVIGTADLLFGHMDKNTAVVIIFDSYVL